MRGAGREERRKRWVKGREPRVRSREATSCLTGQQRGVRKEGGRKGERRGAVGNDAWRVERRSGTSGAA